MRDRTLRTNIGVGRVWQDEEGGWRMTKEGMQLAHIAVGRSDGLLDGALY